MKQAILLFSIFCYFAVVPGSFARSLEVDRDGFSIHQHHCAKLRDPVLRYNHCDFLQKEGVPDYLFRDYRKDIAVS